MQLHPTLSANLSAAEWMHYADLPDYARNHIGTLLADAKEKEFIDGQEEGYDTGRSSALEYIRDNYAQSAQDAVSDALVLLAGGGSKKDIAALLRAAHSDLTAIIELK
jgi:hypothetical protein